jgi:hypothetical protein
VDDGFKAPLEFGAQGQDVATVPLGDEVLLQEGGVLGIVGDALHPVEQAVVGDTQVASDYA